MRKLLFGLGLALAAAAAFAQSPAGGDTASPVGRWRTFDPKTNELRSIVAITAVGDELQGKVVKGFPAPDDTTHGICAACPGDLKGRPIIGMTILQHLRRHGDGWDGGTILDPVSGKTYSLSAHLAKGGQELHLRGYIGVSMFGENRTWVRDTASSR